MMDDRTGAVISADGQYRYRLWRRWDFELPRMCFVMLNPSTADASQDDQTIRKCIEFAKRNGYGGIEVVNLFAYRATKPADLKRAGYPVGETNDAAIRNAARGVDLSGGVVVCAWGNCLNGAKQRAKEVRQLLERNDITLYALKVNGDGSPAHPLMLAYECELAEFE